VKPKNIESHTTIKTKLRGFLLKIFHTPKPHTKTTRFRLISKNNLGWDKITCVRFCVNPRQITHWVDNFSHASDHMPPEQRRHEANTTLQTMRPENSVLCPLAFFVPITFHFHEESLPTNHNNHGEPSNSAGYCNWILADFGQHISITIVL
jgi:hypothetical protein